MAGDVTVRNYRDGAIIFNEGDPGDGMYVVLGGKVRVYRTLDAHESSLATLKEGDFFGEMSLLDHKPRSATARAVGDTQVRFISIFEFEAMIPDPYVRRMLTKMSERIRAVDGAIAKLEAENDARYHTVSTLSAHREWVL